MMSLQTHGRVVGNEKLDSVYFLLDIYCPPIANRIKPGQFIMLKVSDTHFPLLRRPFSVLQSYSSDHSEKRKRGRISLCYKKVGKGTQKMTELKKDQTVDLIGPLGRGFLLPPPSSPSTTVLIGGGVGVVSLFSLAEKFKSKKLFIFIGGRTRHDLLCKEEFKKWTSNLFVATENGSLGFKGTVIDLFKSHLRHFTPPPLSYLYGCGPPPMLRELAGIKKLERFVCQISMEARMACGFGACWGCVIKTKDPENPYQRVCKEGPVFNLNDIAWED